MPNYRIRVFIGGNSSSHSIEKLKMAPQISPLINIYSKIIFLADPKDTRIKVPPMGVRSIGVSAAIPSSP